MCRREMHWDCDHTFCMFSNCSLITVSTGMFFVPSTCCDLEEKATQEETQPDSPGHRLSLESLHLLGMRLSEQMGTKPACQETVCACGVWSLGLTQCPRIPAEKLVCMMREACLERKCVWRGWIYQLSASLIFFIGSWVEDLLKIIYCREWELKTNPLHLTVN